MKTVTGGTGFIGSWLVRRLLDKGEDVTVLVNEDAFGLGNLRDVKDKLNIVKGDIRDEKAVQEAVDGADTVFHLAAITQVLYSVQYPRETFEVNALGTLNVLEAMRKANDAFLVLASTDKVYGEPQRLPLDEEHPLQAKSPYDASKIAADRYAHSYHKTYGLGVAISRNSNTYGGADFNLLRAVPDFASALLSGEAPVIRGHGEHKRDFMHVDDIVDAYLTMAEKRKKANGEAFNFGTNKETTVKELAETMIKLNGAEKEPVILNKHHHSEIDRQVLAYDKAKRILGWEPKVGMEDGLQRTMQWYRENSWWKEVAQNVSNAYGVAVK